MDHDHNAAAWLLDRHLDAGRGDRTAYRVGGTTVTYEDLQAEVWRVQNALRLQDVRRGERVALVVDDEAAFPAWFLGCLRSGSVPVPLSTMLTAGELAAIVADSEARTVVVSTGYRGHLDTLRAASPELRHTLVVDEAPPADHAEAPVAPTGPDSPAFWLYSSGTTGEPKGVMHRHGSLRATAETYARAVLEIGPDDRCLSVPKLFFAYGLGNSLTFPLSVGASAVLNPRPPTPPDVVGLLRDEQPTLFFATPGFIAALLDAEPPADVFASVRCTVSAGEALPLNLQRRFEERFGHPVLDGLGTTEALHIFLSGGRPVPGYDARLVDDAGDDVAQPDEPGYLEVRGPSLATGYWCRDAATRAAFRGEWLRTGDVYRRSADGAWTFLGRNNDMIKAGGIWVSPAEVEGALVEHPDVLEAAVVGGRDEHGLESTVAFLVARSGRNIDGASVEAHCRERMAAFKRPRRIEVVDALPKTPTGKIRRFALRERLATESRA